MTRKKYNGWTNYETWVVKLWMDYEEGSYLHWKEMAEMALKQGKDEYWLAKQLKEEHEEALPEVKGFAADLINASMFEVNWQEIAKSLIREAKETE